METFDNGMEIPTTKDNTKMIPQTFPQTFMPSIRRSSPRSTSVEVGLTSPRHISKWIPFVLPMPLVPFLTVEVTVEDLRHLLPASHTPRSQPTSSAPGAHSSSSCTRGAPGVCKTRTACSHPCSAAGASIPHQNPPTCCRPSVVQMTVATF